MGVGDGESSGIDSGPLPIGCKLCIASSWWCLLSAVGDAGGVVSSVNGDLFVGIVSNDGAKKPVGRVRILSRVTERVHSLCACSTSLSSLRCSRTALLNVDEAVASEAGSTTSLHKSRSGRSAV